MLLVEPIPKHYFFIREALKTPLTNTIVTFMYNQTLVIFLSDYLFTEVFVSVTFYQTHLTAVK